ncbi:hypothetical protein H5410_040911 [Solanum commersonii]|uniref:Uncharacterized protein n=1 Tax=Solanum commersonii TaxID=4109 RepID=A0A9J5XRI0_SOLCO|nr:hypothetical protein H5410_040911 [Solanum commersonii]
MESSNDQSKELTTINPRKAKNTPLTAEGKAAKIQRLKSGFRLENCSKIGYNMMNYSTGNKTTTFIKLNDVPHNVGEGFLQAPISRQTITTTTTVTPYAFSSLVKGVKMSKAQ